MPLSHPPLRQAHTNTSKSSTFMPLSHPPLRQAPRIPQSSKLICLFLTCRSGKPHKYFKAPGSNASTPPVAPTGRTNTSKFPVSHASVRPAETGRPFEYLKAPLSNASSPPAALAGRTNTSKFPVSHASVRPAETGRPFEYLKAPLSNASSPPAPPAGHSNTKKVKAQVPPPFKSLPKGNFTTLSPDPPPSAYPFPAAFRRW